MQLMKTFQYLVNISFGNKKDSAAWTKLAESHARNLLDVISTSYIYAWSYMKQVVVTFKVPVYPGKTQSLGSMKLMSVQLASVKKTVQPFFC